MSDINSFDDIGQVSKKEYSELTDREREQIVEYAIYGIGNRRMNKTTVSDIAQEVGATPLAVSKSIKFGDEQTILSVKKTQFDFRGYRHPSVLEQLHHEKMWSVSEIVDFFDSSHSTIVKWFDECGVKRRNNHSQMWKGHSAWDEVVVEVLERDDNMCQICGIGNEEHQNEHGERLHIHHVIEEDAFDDSDLAADPQNLIALCKGCHREHEGRTPREMFIRAFCEL